MKLIEALKLNAEPPSVHKGTFAALLACGFTPAHLQTFLQAELQLASGGAKAQVRTGLYGDLIGTVRAIGKQEENAVAVVIEWPDLDARLGFRSSGGWMPESLPDIQDRVSIFLDQLRRALLSAPDSVPIALSLPTLPLPPLFINGGWEAGSWELALRGAVAAFAAAFSDRENIRVLNAQRLDTLSPPNDRYDARMDHASGFPYRLPHASVMANLLARLLREPQSKKGLITDLDNTLWNGILGEDGVEGIAWDLDSQSQIHGLFQQLLASLAESGVLVGVVSKNDPALVERAFARLDILLSQKKVFPIAASWSSKAGAVAEILKTWNIGADATVFVDDSPIELAEVSALHPAMECILFPYSDPDAAFRLLYTLRDRFARRALSQEDKLRSESIRRSAVFQSAEGDGFSDTLLATAEAELNFHVTHDSGDKRAFDLTNKTNQFNLNGRRFTENEWHAYLDRKESFLLTVDYKDRFGPLGKIAAICGKHTGPILSIDSWVMSCRAFSRRVEHQCIRQLFNQFEIDNIEFNYEPTPRNGPIRQFFLDVCGEPIRNPIRISREEFDRKCPLLYHRVEVNGCV